MICLRSILTACCFALALATNGSSAFAGTPAMMYEKTAGMSLDQAIAMVQMKYGAKVMRANSVEEDGRVVHYIRLMTQDRSRVWTVRVDAATGREF